MIDGIFISSATLSELSPRTRDEIIRHLAVGSGNEANMRDAETLPDQTDEYELATLSYKQVESLIRGMSHRPVLAMKAISDRGPSFSASDIARAVGVSPDDWKGMGPIWGAITKRTNTVLGHKDEELISWKERRGEDDEFEGWEGRISHQTHQSLQAYFSTTTTSE